MRYSLMSGAGNLFVVIDGFSQDLPRDPAALARAVCMVGVGDEAGAGVEPRPDGLILVRASRRGADCAMEIYNADGSRPETCGNGLRCAAKLAAELGRVDREEFTIETDAGIRDVHVEWKGGRVVSARVGMGRARIPGADEEIVLRAGSVRGTIVDVGNPHFVILVDDERGSRVGEWGPALASHPRFPAGTNVEFLARRTEALHLRVWERGVGETRACGSGACAAAVVAERRGLAHWPVRLDLPGGTLEVDRDPSGELTLSGPVEEIRTDVWAEDSAGRRL
jgi:diaminopimelate epimerase